MKNVFLILITSFALILMSGCKLSGENKCVEACVGSQPCLDDCEDDTPPIDEEEPAAEEEEPEEEYSGFDFDSGEEPSTTTIGLYTFNEGFVGWVMSFKLDFAQVYIPEYAAFFSVNTTTGEWASYPKEDGEALYFELEDCEGTAYANNWNGTVGRTVIFDHEGRHFLLIDVEEHSTNNRLNTVSKMLSDGGGCQNSNHTIKHRVGVFEEIDSIDDLSSFAPLNMFIEQGGE